MKHTQTHTHTIARNELSQSLRAILQESFTSPGQSPLPTEREREWEKVKKREALKITHKNTHAHTSTHPHSDCIYLKIECIAVLRSLRGVCEFSI